MYDVRHINDEHELGIILAACGFDSDPAHTAPVWKAWQREWTGTMPLARYLRGFPDADFVVAIHNHAFQLYAMDPRNDWFRMISEVATPVAQATLIARFWYAIRLPS